MSSPIIECNKLVRLESDIWVNPDQKANLKFRYSDGDDAEEFIKKVLLNAKDLSSHSLELDRKWLDWPSEYHLSSKRANLIRAVDLTGVKTVLELGSGCGALTRYLGELGICVDTVEGSRRRAEITRLRCRDLDKINVICENFNSLDIPKKEYDAILLIGVLEYAKRFSLLSGSHRSAVIAILEKVKAALTDDGIILIAIENRLGFKYLFGASEDHFGVKYIGVYGYPEHQSRLTKQKRGIRTYDKREWDEILKSMGNFYYEFFYPFPDYKIPDVVLSEDYVKKDKYAFSNLFRIHSRDYKHSWSPCVDEYLFWETAASSGFLDVSSNSFAIVIAKSDERIKRAITFDFMHFPNLKRKPVYRTITLKLRGRREIIKQMSHEHQELTELGPFLHRPRKGKYIKGYLLSDIWTRAVKVFDEPSIFMGLIRKYYNFLTKYFEENENPSLLIDIWPLNIIVDINGDYHFFDVEWKILEPITPEYIFFRATLYFGCIQKQCLARLFRAKHICNIQDFVNYCFTIVSLNLNHYLQKFIDKENRFQSQVLLPEAYHSVDERLELNLIDDNPSHTTPFCPKIYWAGEDAFFKEEQSISVSALLGAGCQKLTFVLPPIAISPRRLRFDPIDHGWDRLLYLFKIALMWRADDGCDQIVWTYNGYEEIIRHSKLEGLCSIESEPGGAFMVTSNDPQIIFEVSENKQKLDKGRYIVEIEISI
jgi:cyclopropane fatty-acyl-phospholipid synthase-like methyltransferase